MGTWNQEHSDMRSQGALGPKAIHTQTESMKVPGGKLYRTIVSDDKGGIAVSMVLVPSE